MNKDETTPYDQKVCDLSYLSTTMDGNKLLINDIMKEFLIQVPVELKCLSTAIVETKYSKIKSYAHKMKSTFSIMGISAVLPILNKLEELGANENGFEEIKELNNQLDKIANQALKEIKEQF